MESTKNPTQDEIRQRARELWESHGCAQGRETEFWLQAERELKGGVNSKGVTANAEFNRSGGGSDGRA